MQRRSLPALGLALALLPASRPARATTLDLRWHDAERQRSLPLRLRLPAGNGGATPCPLVLFSHGLGGSVDAGTAWAEAWADAGVATLHLQHPGSDSAIWRDGLRAVRAAASVEQLLARCADVRFVLDELQRRRSEFTGLRLERIGMAGHSFGAHTTLALAGQGDGRASDGRLRAFAAFSPSPGAAEAARAGDPPRRFAGIRRPVLCLTGSLDGDPLAGVNGGDPARRDSGAWRRAVYDALPAGDKAELWLDGADHMSFSGQAATGTRRARERPEAAREQAGRHRSLITAVSSDWWRAQLLDDAEARARLARPPADLQAADAWRRG